MSATTPTMGSNKAYIYDDNWSPDFDMDDHNRMCRRLGIVPQCDIVATAAKIKADIVDPDWRPEFDMEDHNRMCRQLGIVPQCDVVAAEAKQKAEEKPKEKAPVTYPFRLRTF